MNWLPKEKMGIELLAQSLMFINRQIDMVKLQMSTWVKSTKVESHNLHAHCIYTMSIGLRSVYYGNSLL